MKFLRNILFRERARRYSNLLESSYYDVGATIMTLHAFLKNGDVGLVKTSVKVLCDVHSRLSALLESNGVTTGTFGSVLKICREV